MAAKRKSETKKWSVAVPVTGVILCEVEADDEESAIDAALQMEHLTDDIAEWEVHRHAGAELPSVLV